MFLSGLPFYFVQATTQIRHERNYLLHLEEQGSSKKEIWNKSAYIHRNSAKTLRFIVGYIRQVCALDKSAVFFSCSHLNALSLSLFSNSFFSSPLSLLHKSVARI